MNIEEANAIKTTRINTRFSISLILPLVIFMISGSTTTMSYAAPQMLPSCTDPTGQNLRCMMVISTLPPPLNALQCQETSGQLLPCSYMTQNLSNGEQIIAITVYVPTSYVFTGYGSWTVVKHVVHETKTTTKTKLVYEPCPPGQKLNPETGRCVDVPQCKPGQHLIFVGAFICVPIRPPPPICTPLIPCPTCVVKHDCPIYRPPPSCESTYYTGPCPPTDPNAYTKCESAALLANDVKGELACARLLPDTPENAYTKCESEALIKDDLKAELACAQYLQPINSGASSNMTNTTAGAAATPLSNTSSAILPNNTSTKTSGGKSSGPTCVAGNCTSGTPPTVDCTKNPTDPSCTQTLTPSTIMPPSTSVPPTSPTTKTCPDGSVIDASATCPTNTPPSAPPPTSSPPPSTGSQGSPDNNPSPPSNSVPPPSSSGGDNGGSGSGGSGGSGSGGTGGSGGSSTSP